MIRMLKRLYKKTQRQGGQRGMTMLEGLICIGILGGVVILMVFAMSGGALAVNENEEETAVQNLARNQMEYIKSLAYNPGASTYPTISTPPEYSITVSVTAVPDTNNNIQKVTANFYRNSTLLMTVSDYKVNR
ncbi:MAG: type II secretion system protein [Dehalococcoidales bacterium]|nr:type II secretion system protein [Dehalococcoidales bacterium]